MPGSPNGLPSRPSYPLGCSGTSTSESPTTTAICLEERAKLLLEDRSIDVDKMEREALRCGALPEQIRVSMTPYSLRCLKEAKFSPTYIRSL